MDITELLLEIEPKMTTLSPDDHAIIEPVLNQIRIGEIRPVTTLERDTIIRIANSTEASV